jgi:hypothetical protein
MAFRNHPDPLPSVALNAIALVTPAAPIPVAIVPYDRVQLHVLLDRELTTSTQLAWMTTGWRSYP